MNQILFWVLFNIFVVAMLVVDIKVFHREAHVIRIREALLWTGIWITMALLFNVGIYIWLGAESALEFLTGYLIEKALSLDNIFVFLMIFSYFDVPRIYQHRILFWGILGALIMRAIFILAGIQLIERFHWTIYVLGLFLIFTGIRMAIQKGEQILPEKNPALKLIRRFIPITDQYGDGNFFMKKNGRLFATPLFVVLLVIETTDVLFAVDSIPAILAITRHPLIVYTSNVFAILGLRALYFALAGMMDRFYYLHYGLSAILVFVGIKMVVSGIFKIPIGVALFVVLGILVISILGSFLRKVGPHNPR